MKITKREHACLDITNESDRLIVDPGIMTKPLDDYSGITALIITHVHGDHFDIEKVHKIAEQNPSLVIFTTQQVADKLDGSFRVTVPNIGVDYEASSLRLKFFGGLHAEMPNSPQDENIGILLNETLYYPGDSFTPCADQHAVTAIPSTAPWSKLAETLDFMEHDTAKQLFPTHNAIASDVGNDMLASMLGSNAEKQGKEFAYLKPGESLEV